MNTKEKLERIISELEDIDRILYSRLLFNIIRELRLILKEI